MERKCKFKQITLLRICVGSTELLRYKAKTRYVIIVRFQFKVTKLLGSRFWISALESKMFRLLLSSNIDEKTGSDRKFWTQLADNCKQIVDTNCRPQAPLKHCFERLAFFALQWRLNAA